MNQREKTLAVIVGLLLVAVCLSIGARKVIGWLEVRQDRIAEINDRLQAAEVVVHRGKLARQALDVYADRSLPSDTELASSRYRAWLHGWMKRAGIEREDVKYVFARRRKEVCDTFTFSVNCRGDLTQLTQLLFDFYSTDYLHRIKHLGVKRLEDSQLSLSFSIEALALLDVAPDKELRDLPSQRLAYDVVADYINVVVYRNPFAPPNLPPKFVSSSQARGYLNQRVSFQPRATDPDEDRVTYRLGDHDLEGLSIDERSGEISWTPREKGEFEVLVFATDDGLPPQESSQVVTIQVTDPPPPEEPDPGPPPFDTAKFTFVTGIVEVNSRPQVWLTDRIAGKLIKLYEGESFEVGQFQGKIVRIHPRQVEIRSGDALLNVDYGRSLGDATVIDRDS